MTPATDLRPHCPAVLGRLRPPEYAAAADLLAQGIAFSPEVLTRILRARESAGTLPTLLAARDGCSGALLGAGLLDPHRPVAGGRLFTRVAVASDARNHGIGSALARAVAQSRRTDRRRLSVEVDAHDRTSLAVATRWGAVPYQRSLSLELDLTHDVERWTTAPRRQDVTVQALRPDSVDQDWHAAFAVYAAAALDLPDRAGAPAPSYEMFRAQIDHAPGVHVAWRDGTPVGVSCAGPDDGDSWYVFFTGTLGSARRTGVARVLKAALHRTAAAAGVRRLSTSTLDVNTPMLALNASLGYRITGGVVRMQVR